MRCGVELNNGVTDCRPFNSCIDSGKYVVKDYCRDEIIILI